MTVFRKRVFVKVIAFSAGVCLAVKSLTAFAQTSFNPERYFPEGTSVLDTFSGPEGPNGIRGHVVLTPAPDKTKIIVWEAPTGLVFMGKLLDRNGRDLTRLAQQKYNANELIVGASSRLGGSGLGIDTAQGVGVIDKVFNRYSTLDNSHWTGSSSEDAVIVLYDFQCEHCERLHNTLKQYKGIAVKWFPVGILGNDSIYSGAHVLDGTYTVEDMGSDRKDVNKATEESVSRVIYNTALLEAIYKTPGVAGYKPESGAPAEVIAPTVLYRTRSGDVKVISGVPDSEELMSIKNRT